MSLSLASGWDTVHLVQKHMENTVNPVCPSADRCIVCQLATVKEALEEGYGFAG